jgi:GT2 family glycosyltransferase
MTGPFKLSAVVATYNRAETLRETLRHLMDQDLDRSCYEIVISDDGSADNTREIVQQAKAISPVPINYLYHPNSGIGYTQNCGIRAAKAPVILLMADDIFMSRSALRVHLSTHEANPQPEVAVLGNVQQSQALNSSVFLKTWDLFRFSDFKGKTELPYYRFWACNISVKRDFVLRCGGFRENLGRCGPIAHEDVEVGYRLHKQGLRILHRREALADHHHIFTLKQACDKANQQGLNFGELCSFVPEPEIPVAYHVLQLDTIKDHLRAWFGPRRKYLAASDRNPLVVMSRSMLCKLAFNSLTARMFWEPLFARAERDPKIACHMRPAFYRGLIAYHFLLGCAEGNKRFGPARPMEPGAMQIAS